MTLRDALLYASIYGIISYHYYAWSHSLAGFLLSALSENERISARSVLKKSRRCFGGAVLMEILYILLITSYMAYC